MFTGKIEGGKKEQRKEIKKKTKCKKKKKKNQTAERYNSQKSLDFSNASQRIYGDELANVTLPLHHHWKPLLFCRFSEVVAQWYRTLIQFNHLYTMSLD